MNLDDYFCDKFQQLSDWLQETTDKTCFWYATVCASIAFTACVALYLRDNMSRAQVIFDLFSFAVFVHICWRIEREVRPNETLANPIRFDWQYALIRCVSVAGVIVGVASDTFAILIQKYKLDDFLFFVHVCFFTACMYFISCTPSPGNKYKVGKWVDAALRFLFGKMIPQKV